MLVNKLVNYSSTHKEDNVVKNRTRTINPGLYEIILLTIFITEDNVSSIGARNHSRASNYIPPFQSRSDHLFSLTSDDDDATGFEERDPEKKVRKCSQI